MTEPPADPSVVDATPEGTARRPRAPTITIDTTPGEPNMPPTGEELVHNDPHSGSLDSVNARPTSPHNVSSPTSRGNDQNFLAVPGSRSRGNTVDSDETGPSPTSADNDRASTAVDSKPNSASTPSGKSVIHDEDALKPDPGTEADFEVVNNPFAFTPGQMTKLLNPKNLAAFHALGGLVGLEKGLRSDRQAGLSTDEGDLDGHVSFDEATGRKDPSSSTMNGSVAKPTDDHHKRGEAFADRIRVFKDNRLPQKKVKSIFQLAWIAFNDKVLILLTIAAVISLALGLYTTFGQPHPEGEAPVDWVEGVAIMVAVIIVVVVGALNDYQKERQFVKLNRKKEDRTVKIIRSGKSQEISVYDLLVGDVILVEPGDLLPADGIFVEGHNVKCDESSATGESDLIKKQAADEVFRALEANEDPKKLDPFIISGGKVTEGVGRYMVTAVGVNSSYGKIMMSLRDETENTPLQSKLNKLAEQIAKLGGAAALLLFVVLLIKFLAQLPGNPDTPSQKGQAFLQILIVAITIVVVAVPEGLPLAVTLALAFATTRMLKDNNLVRVLRACETMGNATTVCSDKTGTLTQNKMTLVAGTVGADMRFGDKNVATIDSAEKDPEKSATEKTETHDDGSESVGTSAFIGTLAEETKIVLEQSIVLNSTAFEGKEGEGFIGSKTETALLGFAREHLGMGPVSVERANANIVQFVPFDSGRKCMASIVKLDSGMYRMYVKGASEIMLDKCSQIVRDPTQGLAQAPLTPQDTERLLQRITDYASRSLRTIGLLYKDFQQWPPAGARKNEDDPNQAAFGDVFRDMTFLAVVGIQDPLRPGVPEAVRACQGAGVFVRMVTGDNLLTARAIATECGIYTAGGMIMEGPEFRKLSRTRMDQVIPRLQVLARSSPEDKRILVKRLKELGETVAVTGDGTNDAPALKTADVGFSMGIAGTEVAKEASAIILMDDNFSSIVKAIMWGRAVNDAVKKFLQAGHLNLCLRDLSNENEESVLKAVQLLWVNLIMDTFAALALATDPPTRKILDRKPDPKSAHLITTTMWKMIIGQAIYQMVVVFILYFAGARILSYTTEEQITQLESLIFNTFVWMQIFNQYNSRRLDNNFNIFEGIQRNYFFIGINCVMVAGQVMIIFIGGRAIQVVRLNGAQWGISIVLGACSMPVAIVIRLIPDELVRRIIPERWHRKKGPQVVVSDDDEHRFEWNPALQDVREELTFLKRYRGGRLNAIRSAVKHPRETLLARSRTASTRSRSSSMLPQTPQRGSLEAHNVPGSMNAPATPSSQSNGRRRDRSRSNSAFGPATAMAGIIAGSVAGWSPIERPQGESTGEAAGNSAFNRTGAKADLEASQGVEIHPDTKPQDPVVTDEKQNENLTAPPSQMSELSPESAATKKST
ncbi:MAG: hypothetical protein M1817_006910 [Caeruleum heppii]|nr:MAG: hypothetical protein M1817_006910 [Caeruleum heppii]